MKIIILAELKNKEKRTKKFFNLGFEEDVADRENFEDAKKVISEKVLEKIKEKIITDIKALSLEEFDITYKSEEIKNG